MVTFDVMQGMIELRIRDDADEQQQNQNSLEVDRQVDVTMRSRTLTLICGDHAKVERMQVYSIRNLELDKCSIVNFTLYSCE